MSEIKSALELALERTKDIQGDKETIAENKHKDDGKKLASQLLNPQADGENPVEKLKTYSGKELQWVREGFFQVLDANLTLPQDDAFTDKVKLLEKGYLAIIKDRKQVNYIIQQVKQFFEQYLQNREKLFEAVKQQYEPQLREKEKMLAKQMGAAIKLEPESDPEFVSLLSKNQSQLEQQYTEALQQVKEEFKRIFSGRR